MLLSNASLQRKYSSSFLFCIPSLTRLPSDQGLSFLFVKMLIMLLPDSSSVKFSMLRLRYNPPLKLTLAWRNVNGLVGRCMFATVLGSWIYNIRQIMFSAGLNFLPIELRERFQVSHRSPSRRKALRTVRYSSRGTNNRRMNLGWFEMVGKGWEASLAWQRVKNASLAWQRIKNAGVEAGLVVYLIWKYW